MNNILSDLKKAREEFRASGDGTLLAILVDQHFDELSELLAKKPLDLIMGVEEASSFWNLSPGTIKNICNQGRIPAKKVGRTWIVSKLQESPRLIGQK